ncbi:MAG: ATP-binding protein [Patescibacteria group bacterium]
MEDSIERQIKDLSESMAGSAELLRRFEQFERDIRHRDSIWEARLRYGRRGLEVTNRELALTNSKLARANKELSELRSELEKKVEERTRELKVEQDRIQRIIAQLSAGLLLIDEAGKISLINAQAEAFLGITEEQVVRHTVGELSTTSLSGRFFQFLDTIESNTKKRFELSEPEFLVLEVIKTNLTQGSQVVDSIVLLHDMTREAVIEKVKSEFLSIAAHQLRTPLSALKWVLYMVLEGDAGPLKKAQKELLEKGYSANERMIALVNDLLDVVRIEEGRFDYKFKKTGVTNVIDSIVKETKVIADEKGIQLSFHKPSREFPEVALDAVKFRLAASNIITNAVQYTPAKGRVDVELTLNGSEILILVKDTGVGIPKHQLDRLFTKFFRADNAVRMQTAGSGLGLFIAKNIIEKHKGKIWIESEEGKGTTVYFTIPTAT